MEFLSFCLAAFAAVVVIRKLVGSNGALARIDKLNAQVEALSQRLLALERDVDVMRAQRARAADAEAAHPVPTSMADAAPASTSGEATMLVAPATPTPIDPQPHDTSTSPEPVAQRSSQASTVSTWQPEPAPGSVAAEPSTPWTDYLPDWAKRLLGANTLVRTGVLVLFFGVAFLLKWVTERVTFPIEGRLIAAAVGGLALAGLGWRLRERRPGYGLSLQGGGVGLAYITIYAAAKIYQLLPLPLALGLMLAVVALAAALAIAQDAMALAALGAIGGFLAPLLTSTGAGDYRLLLGYYVLLNLGILVLALAKSWRPLNLIGFALTFPFLIVGMAAAFTYENFWSTAPFVWALFAMYVTIAILYARHRSFALAHYVDGTLVFGTPLAVGTLHQMLLGSVTNGMAVVSCVFGLIYLGLAFLVSRDRIVPSMKLLGEAFLAIGIVFLTIAVPLYFGARTTSVMWALEGAAIVWVSVRQQRVAGQAFGSLLQLLAGGWFASALLTASFDMLPTAATGESVAEGMPVMNDDYLGFVVLAVAGFFVARQLLRSGEPIANQWASPFFFWWALGWSAWGIAREIDLFIHHDYRLGAWLGAAALGTAMLLWVSRRLAWRVASYPALALLPVMAITLIAVVVTGEHLLAHWALLAWAAAFIVQYRYIALLDTEPGFFATVARLQHGASFLLGLAFVLVEAHWLGSNRLHWTAGTMSCVYLGLVALALGKIAVGSRQEWWPFRARPAVYLLGVSSVLIVGIVFGILNANISSDGTNRLPVYLPLLNPVDFASILSLAALAGWQWTAWQRGLDLPWGRMEAAIAFGAPVFFVINCMLLRVLHHWAGTPYGDGMLHSTLVQTVLTIFWTVLSVIAMLYATRRGRRIVWFVGGGLLGVVVVKLFFFDLATLHGLERIVAFLAVGGLLLAIGYFSPVPPKEPATRT